MVQQAPPLFGQVIRTKRNAKGIGFREFARQTSISAAYLAKIEQDRCAPPTEDRVLAFAEVLGENPDELLALAGRIRSDVIEAVVAQPHVLPDLIRMLAKCGPEALERFRAEMRQMSSHSVASRSAKVLPFRKNRTSTDARTFPDTGVQ